MKELVNAPGAPAAIGPYSHAAAAGGFMYTSGQLGADPATGALVGKGTAEQTAAAIANLETVLAAGGFTLQDVIKTVVFLDDLTDFSTVNKIYEQKFAPNKPARSCVEVSALPKGAKVEIEAVAYKAQ